MPRCRLAAREGSRIATEARAPPAAERGMAHCEIRHRGISGAAKACEGQMFAILYSRYRQPSCVGVRQDAHRKLRRVECVVWYKKSTDDQKSLNSACCAGVSGAERSSPLSGYDSKLLVSPALFTFTGIGAG